MRLQGRLHTQASKQTNEVKNAVSPAHPLIMTKCSRTLKTAALKLHRGDAKSPQMDGPSGAHCTPGERADTIPAKQSLLWRMALPIIEEFLWS